MKTTLLVAAAGLLVGGCASTTPQAPDAAWKLVWSDEFDKPGAPDPAKWTYEEGYIRNDEAQYYTRDRRENARVQHGNLVLECRKEPVKNAAYVPGSKDEHTRRPGGDYTSASLTTFGKASWTFGRLEIRAKVPAGLGVWPAIWMLGDNIPKVSWPHCGEIDIMEFVGHTPGLVHGTAHFAKPKNAPAKPAPKPGDVTWDDTHLSSGGKLPVSPPPSSDFHTYAVEWDTQHIDFFYDGKPYHRFDVDDAGLGADNPFRRPQYLILNFALGGSWGGKIDDAILPQRFEIDYVRVYERAK